MVCLRDIKYLTKKKVLAMQPIYYACFPIKVGIEYVHKPQVIKLEGDRLKRALDEPFFLYDDNKMFTTEQEAWDLLNSHYKQAEQKDVK